MSTKFSCNQQKIREIPFFSSLRYDMVFCYNESRSWCSNLKRGILIYKPSLLRLHTITSVKLQLIWRQISNWPIIWPLDMLRHRQAACFEGEGIADTFLNSWNLPIIEEKLPDMTDFRRDIEVEPSNKIINIKIKKVSKFNFTPIFDSCR